MLSQQEVNKRLENFKKVSHQYKLPVTPQKLAIFQILAASCSHPNALEIYQQIKKKFNNISLATVYKNLKKFVELGLIIEIPIIGDSCRYDANLNNHSHAIDLKNDRIYDLEISKKIDLPNKIFGKKVKQTQIIYYL